MRRGDTATQKSKGIQSSALAFFSSQCSSPLGYGGDYVTFAVCGYGSLFAPVLSLTATGLRRRKRNGDTERRRANRFRSCKQRPPHMLPAVAYFWAELRSEENN